MSGILGELLPLCPNACAIPISSLSQLYGFIILFELHFHKVQALSNDPQACFLL